jgi:hypothetical protein
VRDLLARRGLGACLGPGYTTRAHLRVDLDDGHSIQLGEPVLELNFGHVDGNFELDGVSWRIDDGLHQPNDDVGEELLHSSCRHVCEGGAAASWKFAIVELSGWFFDWVGLYHHASAEVLLHGRAWERHADDNWGTKVDGRMWRVLSQATQQALPAAAATAIMKRGGGGERDAVLQLGSVFLRERDESDDDGESVIIR